MLRLKRAPENRSLRVLSMLAAFGTFLILSAATTTGQKPTAPGAGKAGGAKPANPFFAPIDPSTVIDPAKVRGADRLSVWDGVYSEEQAKRGQAVYDEQCADCHSDDLAGKGQAPGLAGPMFHFRWDESPVGAWIEEVRKTMPQAAPGSLSDKAYADICAYVLQANGFPSGKTELPPDMSVLQRIFVDEVRLQR